MFIRFKDQTADFPNSNIGGVYGLQKYYRLPKATFSFSNKFIAHF